MKRAYTLMEVLVVMTILLLLCGLLLGSLRRSAARAAQTTCLSNQHHIGAGMALYTQDYDGQFPRVDNGTDTPLEFRAWTVAMKPYCVIKSCPDCLRPGALAAPWANNLTTGYALNENLNAYHAYVEAVGGKYTGQSEALVEYPALTVEICDVRPCIISTNQPDLNSGDGDGSYCRGYVSLIARETEGSRRHNSGANYTFVDAHTKWYLPEQLDTSLKSTGTRPGFGL